MSSTTVISSVSFDTNVLIYSIDLRDPDKHATANQLVKLSGEANSILALQCLSEFYWASTRKRLLPPALAFDVVRETRDTFKIVPPAEADLTRAMQYHQLHKLPFFDALLWATVERAGCTILFSEDFQDNRTYGAVKVYNPFVPGFRVEEFF